MEPSLGDCDTHGLWEGNKENQLLKHSEQKLCHTLHYSYALKLASVASNYTDKVFLTFLGFNFSFFLRLEPLPLFCFFHIIYYCVQKFHITELSYFCICACPDHELVLWKSLPTRPDHKNGKVLILHHKTLGPEPFIVSVKEGQAVHNVQ